MTPPLLLAGYSDAELMAAYGDTLDDHWHRVLEGEIDRREREQRAAATAAARPAMQWLAATREHSRARTDYRQQERAEWADAAHAQYLAAEAECRGNLLNRRGVDAGIDPWALWSGPAHRADLYASEELRNYWSVHPRITVTEFQRQAAAGRAEERETYRHDKTMGQDAAGQVHRAPARSADRDGTQHGGRARSQHVRRPSGDAGHARAPRGDRAGGAMTAAEQIAQLNQRAAEIRASTAARGAALDVPGQPGTALAVREPIDGDQLLRDTRKFLRHFALWPSEAALNVATVAVAAMHAKDPATGDPAWEYAFKLLYTAAEYGAGKSWFAKLTAALAPSGKVLLEPTKPSLIDMIADRNTIVVTELDELFATAGRNRGIVAVLNASYEPGHFHTRKQGGKVAEIHLFGHQILDGVDTLLSVTRGDMRGLVSRCITIRVRMAPDGYRRPRWDKDAMALAQRGRERLATWMAQEIAGGLADRLADVPADIGSPRRCALYEPLLTVALAADKGDPDGYWSATIRDAAWQTEQVLGMPDIDEDNDLDAIMAAWDDGED